MQVLSKEEVRRVLDAAYTVMEEVGLKVPHEESRQMLAQVGACVHGDIVYVPRKTVEAYVRRCPGEVALHDQLGNAFLLGSDRHFHFSGSDMTKVFDYDSGQVRPSTYRDVVRFTRLADALPNVDGISPHVFAMDLPEELVEPATYCATLANTTKHCLAAPLSPSLADKWIEMCRRVSQQRQDRPLWAGSLMVASVPPLTFESDSLGALFLAARARMPLFVLSGGICGASAPITLAGALTSKVAEGLLMVVLAQAAEPGCPVVWASGGQPIMDMRVADMAEAGPEDCLGSIASAQIASALGLPAYSCSFATDSKRSDVQAGAEKMAGILSSMMGGECSTVNAGAIAKCAVASYEQMVIDDEILGFARRFALGIEVNEDTLALDVIRQVGHGGSYLGEPHTVKYLRTGENVYLETFDRSNPKSEYEDILARAHRKAEQLIAEHQTLVPAGHIAALGECYRQITGQELPRTGSALP